MSDTVKWMRQEMEELREDPVFLTEDLLLEVNENICEMMEDQGVNRAELARRLKWRRSAVTKMLQGNHNISIGRLMKVALALGCTLTAPKFVPLTSHLDLRTEPVYEVGFENFRTYAPEIETAYVGVTFTSPEGKIA